MMSKNISASIIITLRNQGHTYQAIADKFGVSRQYIHHLVNGTKANRKSSVMSQLDSARVRYVSQFMDARFDKICKRSRSICCIKHTMPNECKLCYWNADKVCDEAYAEWEYLQSKEGGV